MVVVDTNILAYLLIEGDRTADAQALFRRDPDWRSDEFVLIEFSNILATYQRSGALTADMAEKLLDTATRTVSLIHTSHKGALKVAMEFGVSAYDARFLAAARHHESRLVTEDAKLRAAAPTLTLALAEALPP
ncbi:MAG: type II toxin-antitoxin system VapC family toxin [Betaproteobacteria bacterium]|nr:type II toxin-antitoxin system VapC family toxin [Betaproteobacteria bacterium]